MLSLHETSFRIVASSGSQQVAGHAERRNESTIGRKDKCTDSSTSHICVDPRTGESNKTSKDESFTLSDAAGSLAMCAADAVMARRGGGQSLCLLSSATARVIAAGYCR